MTAPVRLGLIGLGHWGRICLRSVAQSLPQAHLTAVSSRSAEGAALSVPLFREWRDLLDSGLCDGVIITTPAHTHVRIAVDAVKKGLAVFVEKPLCTDVSEARAFGDAVASSPVPVVVDHIHLFNPAFRRLVELAGQLGPVLTIEAEAGKPGHPHLPVLWDWGAHDVAMCVKLMECAPDSVEAWRESQSDATGEIVGVEMRFGAVPAKLRLGSLPQRTRRMTVICQQGCLVYDDIAPVNKLTLNGHPQPILLSPPLQLGLREFCQRIVDNDVQRTDVDLAILVVEVLAQAEKSMNR